MKTIIKVFVYNEEVFKGTLNQAIVRAKKENKLANMSVSKLEIWEAEEDYYLTTLQNFWD